MKEISFLYIFQLAWKRLWILILAIIVFATGAFCYCRFVATPVYTATASIMVTNGAITSNNSNYEKVQATDMTASLTLTDTVVEILKTPSIYKKMATAFLNKYSYTSLMGKASVMRKSQETLFINIQFRSSTPDEAVQLANTFVNLTPEYISEFVPFSNIQIASEAMNASKESPKTLFSIAVAGILGAILAFVVIFIVDSLNQEIHGEEDLTVNYNIPLIGVVPDFENAASLPYIVKGGYHNGY